jgi:hypothetical protein
MRISLRPLAFLAAWALCINGCSKSPTGTSSSSSGGSGSTGSTGTIDAGPVDAGPPHCATDNDCTAPQVCTEAHTCGAPCLYDDGCGEGRICNTGTGHCAAAKNCDPSQGATSCDSDDPSNYCYAFGSRCVCKAADGGGGGGYCERVRPLCAPCQTEQDCSTCPGSPNDCDSSNFIYPATCTAAGTGADKFCLRSASGVACPRGYLAQNGVCQPQSGSCSSNVVCSTNAECTALLGAGHLCDVSSGICKETCGFDYQTGSSTNCAPGKVCDVLPEFVLPDAGLSIYGLGKCSTPCNLPGGEDCVALGATHGLTFECVAENSGEHRCRPVNRTAPTPTCMADLECPHTTDGGPYAGYCKNYEFTCGYDCRNGNNPLTGTPYSDNDCQPPSGSDTSFKCQNNACVEKTCVEQGGASFGRTGELCCGEDRDHTGYLPSGFADLSHPVNACAAGVDAGQYYHAPNPPWCYGGCSDAQVDFPDGGGYAKGIEASIYTCGPDFGMPSYDNSPNVCVQYAQGVYGCALAATNSNECPKNFNFGAPYGVGCDADPDCDSLVSDPDGGQYQFGDGGRASKSGLGTCHKESYPDGGKVAYCACTQPERTDAGDYLWGAQCTDESRCYQGKRCVFTVACAPTPNGCK